MNFEFSNKPIETISADILLVFALEQENKKKSTFLPLTMFRQMDSLLNGQLTDVCKTEEFVGKRGSMITVYPTHAIGAKRIVVVGLGNKEAFVVNNLRKVAGKIAHAYHYNIDSLLVSFPEEKELGLDEKMAMYAFAEGLQLGLYEYGKYKDQATKDHTLSTTIISEANPGRKKIMQDALTKARLYAEATRVARDLVNEQATIATPSFLATFAQDIAKSSPEIDCIIIDREQAKKMGMHAFLGIARGSETPPKFIVLTYTPKQKTKQKLAIVGKGITFDSGGMNVKPGSHMQDMKMDMAGAAAVLGIFSVIAPLKPTMSVMGIIAATSNMVSANSIVPGDVVRAMNGKTIEVLNTDAEGRVTMADSLSYAVKHGATEIVDLATLTGACIVALGEDMAGLLSNNVSLTASIKAAAFDAGEKVWELPMDEDMKEFNKSDIADIANIPSNKYAGASTAGLFLETFVDNKPFVHLDIAGPAFSHKQTDISKKGGTGFGVRTMLNYISRKEVK